MGGVSYLFFDYYGIDKCIVIGVGISFSDSSGRVMNFVGWGGCVSNCIFIISVGWYLVFIGVNVNGSNVVGFNNYLYYFIVILKKLLNGILIVGKIDVIVYVLVKI